MTEINKALSIDNIITHSLVTLEQWEKLETQWNKIITVVKGKIWEKIKWVLDTFNSSVFHNGEIMAFEKSLLSVFDIKDLDIILNKINVDNNFWEFCRKNWTSLFDLTKNEEHKNIDLYRGDQIDVEFEWVKYKLNLWFCGKEVDCLFHNEHNFEETHTWVAWDWYMQKADYEGNLVETVWILPWLSHKNFYFQNEKEKNWNPKYPFHRWLGGTTGNIWLVVERY